MTEMAGSGMHDGAADAGDKPIHPNLARGIRLLARLARVAERACQESGVSLPQYRLLVSISGSDHRPSQLAEKVGVSRPTLTSLVDGLVHAGLLRRVPVPNDRRGIHLETTEEGQRAISRAETHLAKRMLELIDAEQAAAVNEVVSAVGAALDREGRRLPRPS
jgi:DNA-binding MarR family transcriptional regulator